ncbi:MAG: TatD family hydrolase [Chloroflexi bacterium]|nr:TatD family hydrolase [Chloroflexota bacterium]
MLADCHTHLDQFPSDEVSAMLQRAQNAGVDLIITVGTTVASSAVAVALAEARPILYAGVGVHPRDIKRPLGAEDFAELRRLALSSAKALVISETGLDYLPTSPDHRVQQEAFRGHIRLARDLGKPLVVHSREANSDVLRLLREERAHEAGIVMHYFQGDADYARDCLDLGCYLSLAKPLLRLPGLQEVVRSVAPLERIVLETDSYPQPWKKHTERRTEPSHVRMVAEKLAELKGMTVNEVERATTANLTRVLRLTP